MQVIFCLHALQRRGRGLNSYIFFKMPELTLQQQQKFYEQIAIEFLHFSFLSLLFFQIFKIASFYYFLVT